MIKVSLYTNDYPCKCSGKWNYSKAHEDAGKQKNMDFDKFIGKDFLPKNGVEFLINNYLKPSTFLNK